MRSWLFPLLLLFLIGGAFLAPAQETLPAGITCCDEQKIRQAMAEEALQRIVARHQGGVRPAGDYLSDRAFEAIRRRLPSGSRERLLDFLRAALQLPAPDEGMRHFQEAVGHFVLGMTLEIGHTFQDEYDQAQACKERIDRLLGLLESSPVSEDQGLSRALFQADLSERELRRIRALERRWKEAQDGASPFDEFNILKKNVSGRLPDPDQRMVFGLAEVYSGRFPFLDEFLANYRRLAADFREASRRVNALLAIHGI